MKALGLLLLGSVATAVVLSLLLLVFWPQRKKELPAYWLGLISALLWFPAFLLPAIAAASKDQGMPLLDWAIAVVVVLPVLGVWSLLCSIPVRATGAIYRRARRKKQQEQSGS